MHTWPLNKLQVDGGLLSGDAMMGLALANSISYRVPRGAGDLVSGYK